MHGDSFNNASTIGPYGAEPYIWALAICLVIYSIWLLLCLFDYCIKKPKQKNIKPEKEENEDKNVED